MIRGISAVERAFQLARTGEYPTLQSIRSALNKEGYNPQVVQGPLLRRQLAAIILQEFEPYRQSGASVDKLVRNKIMR